MNAEDRIMQDEGLRLTVYDDATGKPIVAGSNVVGNPTIGYGRLLCAPGGISSAEANNMLNIDWLHASTEAATLPCYARLNDARRGVLAELVFQIGLQGVRKFTQMLAALAGGDFDRAGDELIDSKLHDQTPERTERLADILRRGHA